ncbi:flavocytochrome c [Ferrimonas lipolytica]|uniref:Flavocytochrome c n=1 Tax=Ferrimonas lipolytica TaxID=2724191 RepID=A0A6H1UK38_9GAMM|nr:flavocytochrome c [Ferrimonas lipolytica]QIZ78683.1 flavocytochrome c [Ferrimonas lipolytica]
MSNLQQRRDFLKRGIALSTASITGGTLLSSSATAATVTEDIKWDEHYDVVVIGSGLAGLSAAYAASENKASVVVFEKMKTIGGNSAINAGSVAVAGSDYQKEKGIKDSPELLYQDMLKAGRNLNHPELTKHVCDHTWPYVKEYCIDKWGVEFTGQVIHVGGHSVPRVMSTQSGSKFINAQVDACKKNGVVVQTRTMIDKIISDENNNVIGVRVREKYRFGKSESGKVKHIRANKGVVLSGGGFTGDQRYVTLQEPTLQDARNTGQKGATSELLIEALKAGCNPVHLSWVQQYPLSSPDEKGFGFAYAFSSRAACVHGMLVRPDTSKRFMNELGNRKQRADAIIASGHPAIAIADSVGFGKVSHSKIPMALENKSLKKFDTLEELAKEYDLDVAVLKGEIARYNELASTGKDVDFNRKMSGVSIAKAPFYAARCYPKVHHTMGGVQINVHGEAIGLDGEVIKGLYAAGEMTGGVHGAVRLGACAIADCIVFGITAGKSVSAA